MDTEQWELSALDRLLREGSEDDIRRFFLLLRPPELADLLEHIPDEARLRIVRLMNAPLASEVLRAVEDPERDEILEDLSAREIAEIVHESMSDDAADILGSLPREKAERTLGELEHDEQKELRGLLEHGEETAGGIMQTELVKVRSDQTVGDAIAAVRAADKEEVGEIHEVFVVDSDGRLVGTVSPADLLHGEEDEAIRRVLEPNPISVPLSMDQEQIAELVREHDLAAIPVVDEWDVLVGQVSHDDVADVIEEEATEDIARMAGSDPEEVYGDSVMLSIRSRAPWLIPAFVGGLAASLIIASMEDALADALLLAAFLPVVIGMAGGVGGQAAVVTVRSLALGRLELTRLRHVFVREGLTGLVLGVLFGLILFVFTLLSEAAVPRVEVYALTLGVSICVAMTVGTLFGVLVPLSLHRIGIDPAIATTPFVQTANDVIGVGVLFWVAGALGLIG